ncbi:hypothetical protein ACFLZY_01835 [Patescibacteria group bacterium]
MPEGQRRATFLENLSKSRKAATLAAALGATSPSPEMINQAYNQPQTNQTQTLSQAPQAPQPPLSPSALLKQNKAIDKKAERERRNQSSEAELKKELDQKRQQSSKLATQKNLKKRRGRKAQKVAKKQEKEVSKSILAMTIDKSLTYNWVTVLPWLNTKMFYGKFIRKGRDSLVRPLTWKNLVPDANVSVPLPTYLLYIGVLVIDAIIVLGSVIQFVIFFLIILGPIIFAVSIIQEALDFIS